MSSNGDRPEDDGAKVDDDVANYQGEDDVEDTKEGIIPVPAPTEHTYSSSGGGGRAITTEDETSNLLTAVQELRDEGQINNSGAGQEIIVFSHPQRHGHEEDDQTTNSTISTLEASGQSHEDLHLKVSTHNMSGPADNSSPDMTPFTADNHTLEWLNNSVAVAISNGVLPVTCKQLKGELHLNKFGSGNRGKCINAYGQWFTPTEFEAFAGRAQCKDWKRSIKFQERALLQLIELNILKVHAVSCTCPACWNGESSGPVRLHDTKRKTSSFSINTTKRVGSVGQEELESKSPKSSKRARTDSMTSLMEPPPSTSTPVQCSAPSIVRSPGGTLRLVSNGSQAPQPVRIMTQGSSGQQQTISLMLQPPAGAQQQQNNRTPQKSQQTIYVSVPASSSGSTVPVGVSYTPVQVMSQGKVVSTATTVSNPARRLSGTERPVVDIFEQLTGFEKVTTNLQQQVNQLQSLIFGLRQKTEKAMTDMRQRTLNEKEKEIRALKKALSQMQQASQQETGEGSQQDTTDKKLCENCNRIALMACGLCHQAFYCSEFCATKDMQAHKHSCRNEPQPNPVEMVDID